MNQNEVKGLIVSNIQLSMSGQEVEHAKLEFKKEWYNLKDEKGIAAFLKDTCAIVNTVGPDGYLVIGFDTKANQYNSVQFSDSGLRDSSDLPGIIVKHVDRAFMIDYFPIEVDGHVLNVIHIPPSLDKPHVIRNHKSWPGDKLREEVHRIFVRKGSTIREASKYDLDLMNYDRKNIQPEYQVYGTIHLNNSSFHTKFERFSNTAFTVEGLEMRVGLTLENTGYKPLSMARLEGTIFNTIVSEFPEKITFSGVERYHHKILLGPNEILDIPFSLICDDFNNVDYKICRSTTNMWQNHISEIPMIFTFHTTNRISVPVILK
ncbi:ATP-binding protein [Paraflavitalea soli]|uniref:ATP-binding protein n=1 Tax=Paraflavitalea soli TaxID=2315862 RepID=A0A3B7ME48_9BACT|nr:ATP-binding protein [Paraflavitalea soli]AXY72552.1 ATP-binding protein [Paraflavitalea soli]